MDSQGQIGAGSLIFRWSAVQYTMTIGYKTVIDIGKKQEKVQR